MADVNEQTIVRYVRGIIAEDKDKYEITWEPDDETGEQAPPSWVLKSDVNVDQEIIDRWEAESRSMQFLLNDTLPGLAIRSASAPSKDSRTTNRSRCVRFIIFEDASKYLIEWVEAGQQDMSSWHPKSDASQYMIDVWEAKKASMKSVLLSDTPAGITIASASTPKEAWAAQWTRVFNDVLKTVPDEDNPNGAEYIKTPGRCWEEALALCVKFQDDVKAKGFVQDDAQGGGRRWMRSESGRPSSRLHSRRRRCCKRLLRWPL